MKPSFRLGRTAWVAPFVALLGALLGLGVLPSSIAAQSLVDAPQIFVGGVPFDLTVEGAPSLIAVYRVETAGGQSLADGQIPIDSTIVIPDMVVTSAADLPLVVLVDQRIYRVDAPFVPGWMSVVPPLLAIVLAFAFKDVVIALFAAVWGGALAMQGFNPILATLRTIDELVVGTLTASRGRVEIVLFSLLIAGMVGVVSRSGGMRGIVQALSGRLTTRRRGKIGAGALGVAVFFDDYASSLLTGTSMRPITDRLRISREKLAYLVNSTAVSAAAIVPLSTWVGYEIALIAEGLRITAEAQQLVSLGASAAASEATPLSVFLQTIPYRFYPLLTVWLAFLTSWMNRDLARMAAAETRAASAAAPVDARTADSLSPRPETKARWWNAAAPLIVAVSVTFFGIYATGVRAVGTEASLVEIIGAGDPFRPLLWGSFVGCLLAVVLSVAQRALTLRESVDALASGMRTMLLPLLTLVLAWSLGSVTEAMGTAHYLSVALGTSLPLPFIPALAFVVAAAISFLIGTSWGTMAILLPIVIPLSIAVAGWEGVGGDYTTLLGVISAVLSGAVFGDHCSPISDTTILSSAASGCDHMDHVRTQLPYGLLVAAVAIPAGHVAVGFGLPAWVALAIGAAVLYLVLRWRGRPVPERTEDARTDDEISDDPERNLEGDLRTAPRERPV